MVAFFEEIPKFKPARDDMPRWFRYEEVAGSREVFSYFIGDEEYKRLLEYMAKNKDPFQPRGSAVPIKLGEDPQRTAKP